VIIPQGGDGSDRRNFVGVELNPEYAAMAERRIAPHRDQMQMAIT
jgi:DNA modification methylase